MSLLVYLFLLFFTGRHLLIWAAGWQLEVNMYSWTTASLFIIYLFSLQISFLIFNYLRSSKNNHISFVSVLLALYCLTELEFFKKPRLNKPWILAWLQHRALLEEWKPVESWYTLSKMTLSETIMHLSLCYTSPVLPNRIRVSKKPRLKWIFRNEWMTCTRSWHVLFGCKKISFNLHNISAKQSLVLFLFFLLLSQEDFSLYGQLITQC